MSLRERTGTHLSFLHPVEREERQQILLTGLLTNEGGVVSVKIRRQDDHFETLIIVILGHP